ncbi:bifunctional (p)ppGpp synthetase/guanosine-3',5'-bis(diphosphate) 3'-pyrophosphohydrolase [Candidatus Gracilibacteria bacterium]|nr:bifunctional (p)ppGpp synthetase/guanosine-3',5'-bis(diphosphate) 3'-pyrophosphohydrolase [Candidatus Gracilibacteria bacterium]
MRLKLNNYEKAKEKIANEMIADLKGEFKKNGISVKIKRRRKNFYSIYKKICSSNKGIDCIDNRIALRVIVANIADCYQVLGITHAKFTPKNSRFKDYIANPKSNGYQSLHTNVFGPSGVTTEMQIRTQQMDTEDKYGIMAHYFASESCRKGNLFAEDKRSVWVNKILEIEKEKNGSFLEDIKLDIFEDRIFVFTPKGRSIDLPKGASVIDFAYAIHSEIGSHAQRAEINGLLRPISASLKSGDQVNVITSKELSPDHSWLSFAKTNFAKKKIKEHFKKVSNKIKVEAGKKLLQKQLDISGLGFVKNMNSKKIGEFGTRHQMLTSIGEGVLDPMVVVDALQNKKSGLFFKESGLLRRFFYRSMKDGIRVNAKIKAKNQFGLMREVSEVFYTNSVDMMYFKAWTSASCKEAYMNVQVIVKDLKTVRKIFDRVKQIDGVQNVYRVSSRGLIFFSLIGALTIFGWIVHPFIYRYVGNSEMAIMYPAATSLILEGLLLALLFSVVYLTNVATKYFPIVRSRVTLWTVAFMVPLIAFVLLYTEVAYFGLELSRLSIVLEILMFYIYLGMNFTNYKKAL